MLRDLLRNGLSPKKLPKKMIKQVIMNDNSDSESSIDCDEESDNAPMSTNS